MRKGVSPLVAVVMLIAFTLLVAGILGAMVTQFSQQQRAEIQYCTGAQAIIISGFYTAAANTVTLNVHNSGDVNLSFTLFQTGADGAVVKVVPTSPTPFEIGGNDIDQVVVDLGTGVLSDVDEYTIQSLECSGVQDLIRVEDLKNF